MILSVTIAPASSVQAGVLPQESGNTIFLPVVSYQLPPPAWLGPAGGRVVVLAIDPSNPQTVYAGSWGAGVYKSIDGGSSWKQASSGIGNLYINSLAIDPQNPLVLYAGTYMDGVYKTADGGLSWAHANQGVQDFAIVYTIAVDPTDSNRVYIGTRSGAPWITNRPWYGVAYRSTNGGSSWTAMNGTTNVGDSGVKDWFYSIAVNPNNPSIVLAAAHESGPMRSLDYGQNWSPAKVGIFNCAAAQNDGCHGRSIVFDPRLANSGTAYLGTWRGNGVYKTTDNGSNWSQKVNGLADTDFYHLAIDPNNPSTLYAATFGGSEISAGIRKSTNSGESWLSAGLTYLLIYTVEVDPQNSSTVYTGTVGAGLYKSTNAGTSWVQYNNGLNNSNVTSTIVTAGDSKVLYAAMNDSGVARSLDGGQTWSNYSNGLGDLKIHAMASPGDRKNTLYALTDQSGVYILNTAVGQWNPAAWVASAAMTAEPGFDSSHPFASRETLLSETVDSQGLSINSSIDASVQLLSLAFAPSHWDVIFVGTSGNGVYKSYDRGGRWEYAGLTGLKVWGLAVHPTKEYLLYAATNTPGVIKMSNGGGYGWTNTSLPDGNLIPYTVMFSPANPSIVYAGTSGGVFRRTNDGPWIFLGLEGLSVTALAEQPGNSARLYAGSIDGLRVSNDSGATWEAGPSELDGVTVQSITIDPNDAHFLFANTMTNGILRLYFR